MTTATLEEPRLGGFREAIESLLGEVTSARVNVKATSNERMGWIGRGEGIAALAVVQVVND